MVSIPVAELNEAALVEAGVKREDLAEVLLYFEEQHDYAEETVYGLALRTDGEYVAWSASCDTTGWDCQASGECHVSADAADCLRWLPLEARS